MGVGVFVVPAAGETSAGNNGGCTAHGLRVEVDREGEYSTLDVIMIFLISIQWTLPCSGRGVGGCVLRVVMRTGSGSMFRTPATCRSRTRVGYSNLYIVMGSLCSKTTK